MPQFWMSEMKHEVEYNCMTSILWDSIQPFKIYEMIHIIGECISAYTDDPTMGEWVKGHHRRITPQMVMEGLC